MTSIPISVHVLTKNSEKTLTETLQSLSSFEEVIVLDTGSTDNTFGIVKQFPQVKLYSTPFKEFGVLHNEAAGLSTLDWILSIDSDEVLSAELVEEIQNLVFNARCVYSIQRDNYFNGKKIWFCSGWYPDRIVRLYNRKETQFSLSAVHEKVLVNDLQLIKLKHTIKHTPYLTMDDFLKKMDIYTSLYAAQHKNKKKASFHLACFQSCLAFFKNYFLKYGFLGGKEGFILSLYNAQTTYYKYLKLAELNKNL